MNASKPNRSRRFAAFLVLTLGGGALFNTGACLSDDGQWWIMFAQNEATPTQSYFLFVDQIPSQVAFGVHNGKPQYLVRGLK